MLLVPTPTATTYLKLSIPGYDGRINDLLYGRPIIKNNEKQTVVVYFGGDIQDFNENMRLHFVNKKYSIWCLENIAQLLQNGYPNSHIVIIRPLKLTDGTFSCYTNFVPSDLISIPEFAAMHNSLQHLKKLLENLSEKLRTINDNEIEKLLKVANFNLLKNSSIHDVVNVTDNNKWIRDNIELNEYNLTLIGFSKGCVVLNQFLYEFHYLKPLSPEYQTILEFLKKITDMYWLDGGHGGTKNTWITSETLLETFSKLGISAHIHVTPFQIECNMRPWLKKEEKTFYDLLCKYGASINRTVHFSNKPPDITYHFKVLVSFLTNNSSVTRM